MPGEPRPRRIRLALLALAVGALAPFGLTVSRTPASAGTSEGRGTEQRGVRRVAFKMKLKPGAAAEYKRRHDEIWPDLVRVLRGVGITNYSIFLDEPSLTLFGVFEVGERDGTGALDQDPVVQRWSAYMSDLMEPCTEDPAVCGTLTEVFHMD